MNPTFKNRNTDRLTRGKYKLNPEIPKPNQATFRTKNYGRKIWNALSNISNIGMVTMLLLEFRNIQLQDNRLLENKNT